MKSKKVFLLLIFISLFFIKVNNALALDFIKSSDHVCTLTDDYIKWSKLSQIEKSKVMEPIKCEEYYMNTSTAETGSVIGDPTASSFNLKELGYSSASFTGLNKNLCWAFAAMDSAESAYMVENNKQAIEFSELHVGLSTLRDFSDGTNYLGYYNRTSLGTGGSYYFSSNYLSKRVGPVLESTVPFDGEQNLSNATVKNEYIVESIDMMYNSSCSSTTQEKIKNFLVKYGATTASMYVNISYMTNNSGTYAYYYNGSEYVNHAVSIIGWDDNYSASNFSGSSSGTPSGNGAWLVQDSMGSYGETFYISYYDSNICTKIMSVHDVNNNVSDNSYSYTYRAYADEVEQPYSTIYFKSKFSNTDSNMEKLDSVVVGTIDDGERHDIYYSTDGTLTSATLVGSVTANGWGYRSVNPTDNIYIDDSEFYIIDKVTKQTTTENNYRYEISYISSNLDDFCYEPTKNEGVSFYSVDNGVTWLDSVSSSTTSFYASISAFTSNQSKKIIISNTTPNSNNVDNVNGYYFYEFSLTGLTINDINVKIYDNANNDEVTDKFIIARENNGIKIYSISGVTESGTYKAVFYNDELETSSIFTISNYQEEITSISLSGASEIAVNGSTMLTVTTTPNGVYDNGLTYTSSDNTIATVDSNGIIQGLKAGNVTITVRTSNGVTATHNMTIINTKELDDSNNTNNNTNNSNNNTNKTNTNSNTVANPSTGVESVLIIMIILLVLSYGLDYIARRKKFNDN